MAGRVVTPMRQASVTPQIGGGQSLSDDAVTESFVYTGRFPDHIEFGFRTRSVLRTATRMQCSPI